jgi:hypothetical protein
VDSAPLSYRNKIINGDMRIDQRNAGASVTITNIAAITYVLDRFYAYGTVSSKFSVQRNSGAVTPPAGFTNYLGVTSLSAYTPVAGDEFSIGQTLEGFNVADLGWGTADAKAITISFWARSSLTGTFSCAARNSATNRGYVFTYSISSANTWEYKTVTIPGDTSGTWLTDNNVGIYLSWSLGAGATKSTTAGSWAAGTFINATGATSVVGTNGATFYLTGVQLEVGSKASAFERRPYGLEEQLCKRYCHVTSGGLQSAGVPVAGTSWVMTVVDIFPVQMRAVPVETGSGSITVDLAGVTGNSVGSGTLGISIWGPSSARIECISGVSAAYFRSPSRQRIYSAEL